MQLKSDFISPEDQRLWEKVTSHVRPLHSIVTKRKDMLSIDENNNKSSCNRYKKTSLSLVQALSACSSIKNHIPPAKQIFDSSLYKKIARRRLVIPMRIDLHGLSQNEAYSQLLFYLQSAQRKNIKYVMVITGKGTTSNTGILRKSVPHWFETASFYPYVHSFKEAVKHHGGSGALYIKLHRLSKRNTEEAISRLPIK